MPSPRWTKYSVFFQQYLHIVDSLNIPSPDPQYLLDLIRHKHWGESLLIVDVWVGTARAPLQLQLQTDFGGSLSADVVLVAFRGEEFPENILQATAGLKTVNIIPAIGKLALSIFSKRWRNAPTSVVKLCCTRLCGLNVWELLLPISFVEMKQALELFMIYFSFLRTFWRIKKNALKLNGDNTKTVKYIQKLNNFNSWRFCE